MRLLCIFATAATLASCAQDRGPIVLGLAGPFGQPRGVVMERAARLAIDEINARGGVRGRDLAFVVLDDSADPGRAIHVAQELYADPAVVAVVGHLTSGTTLAAAAVYNSGEQPLVAVSPSASAPAIGSAGPYTFRIGPSDEVHGAALALWARQRLGAGRAAIFYENEDYGRGVRSTFQAQFEGAGGTIAAAYPFVSRSTNFEPLAAHASRIAGADLAMIAGTRREGEQLLEALRFESPTLPIVTSDGMAGIETARAIAEGVYVSAAWLPDGDSEATRRFVDAYRRAWGGDVPDHRGAGAYDVIYLLAQAIEAVGPDRERIQAYLAAVGTRYPAFEGVTGRTAFDGHGDVVGKSVTIGVVRGGRLVSAERR